MCLFSLLSTGATAHRHLWPLCGILLRRLIDEKSGCSIFRLEELCVAGHRQLLCTRAWTARASDDRAELLKARESVWRSWFANDTKALEALVPPDTIVISSGEEKWKNQADILESAAKFHAAGGKLIRLEFPRTEIQRFGEVAMTYSQYLYETEEAGKRSGNLRPRHRNFRPTQRPLDQPRLAHRHRKIKQFAIQARVLLQP